MRFPILMAALFLSLPLAGCLGLGQDNDIVDEVTLIHGKVTVEMNYTTDYLPLISETYLRLPHCSYHRFDNGELLVNTDIWDSDVSTVIMIDYSGVSYSGGDGGGSRWVGYLTNSTPLVLPAALNTSLFLYRSGPSIEGYIYPIVPVEKNNGSWNVTYEVHDRENTNNTYTVQESLTIKVYDKVKVIQKEPYLCK